MENCNLVFDERKSKNIKYLEFELTREFIFSYAMSMLARYRVETWGRLIESKRLDPIHLVPSEVRLKIYSHQV
jgi:hypothetical protein